MAVKIVYFCFGHAYIKRERISNWIPIFFCTATPIFMSVKEMNKLKGNIRLQPWT